MEIALVRRQAGLLIATSLFVVPCNAAQVDETLFGKWATTEQQELCAAEVDDVYQPLTLSKDTLIGYEMSCQINSWNRSGPFHLAKAACSGEGEEWADDYYFGITSNGSLVVGTDDSVVTMQRCK